MQITHLGHAAVLVEVKDQRLLIDPGNFSNVWHGLTDLDAILVTHQHADHLDPEQVPALVADNPRAQVHIETEALAQVPVAGAQALEAGTTLHFGEVSVEAVGGRHAVIHRDIPRIGNVGLVVRASGEPTFFHPGDALDVTPEGIDVLAVPGYGPWAAMKETIDFARAVAAGQGFIIHEGLLAERGFQLVHNRIADMTDTTMHDLRDGTPLQL